MVDLRNNTTIARHTPSLTESQLQNTQKSAAIPAFLRRGANVLGVLNRPDQIQRKSER